MGYIPSFTAGSSFTAVSSDRRPGVAPERGLSPLEEELSLMDAAIPMTFLPEWDEDSAQDEDHDLAGLNLFSPVMEDDAEMKIEVFWREPRRARAAQARIVALRRRAVRTQLHRTMPGWPLRGQGDGDLRNMRAHILAPDTEALAAQEKHSVPLRIATHAIGLTLVATALPVGAAMMTYNLLKGEDIKITARLTTLTGLALAFLAGNPQLAQLIGA